MMDINWQETVNETTLSPRDVLLQALELVDKEEVGDIVVIANLSEQRVLFTRSGDLLTAAGLLKYGSIGVDRQIDAMWDTPTDEEEEEGS
jgi:hypothetical protein